MMRQDRPASRVCIVHQGEAGVVYEMDVQASKRELAALVGVAVNPMTCVLEPWVRITCGVDITVSAGVEVITEDT